MKNIKIRDVTPPSEYDSDTPFNMVFIKENKSRNLCAREVKEDIDSRALNKFVNCLNYMEEKAVL